MDNGEVELSDPVLLPNSCSSNDTHQGSASVDSIIDGFLKHTRTCTHTHTCNPPGPDDAPHTHTCYHTHTQVFSSEEDNQAKTRSSKSKRPLGNREAVRKYREKKKAHTAYLEEEVKKLRGFNQQLVRKLQRQVILEAEILKLRSLLYDFRGKIDNEVGSVPFHKYLSSNTSISFKDVDCGIQSTEAIGLQCQADIPCFQSRGNQPMPVVGNVDGASKAAFSWERDCQPAIVDCRVNGNGYGNENGSVGASDRQLQVVEAMVSDKQTS